MNLKAYINLIQTQNSRIQIKIPIGFSPNSPNDLTRYIKKPRYILLENDYNNTYQNSSTQHLVLFYIVVAHGFMHLETSISTNFTLLSQHITLLMSPVQCPIMNCKAISLVPCMSKQERKQEHPTIRKAVPTISWHVEEFSFKVADMLNLIPDRFGWI